MQLRRLISAGLLFTVLVAPVLGLAICASGGSAGMDDCAQCAAHAMKGRGEGWTASLPHNPQTNLQTKPAPLPGPVAPCCQRKAPTPAIKDSNAQIVAPVQIALMAAASPDTMLTLRPAPRLKNAVAPPSLASPLSLLCTLLI